MVVERASSDSALGASPSWKRSRPASFDDHMALEAMAGTGAVAGMLVRQKKLRQMSLTLERDDASARMVSIQRDEEFGIDGADPCSDEGVSVAEACLTLTMSVVGAGMLSLQLPSSVQDFL